MSWMHHQVRPWNRPWLAPQEPFFWSYCVGQGAFTAQVSHDIRSFKSYIAGGFFSERCELVQWHKQDVQVHINEKRGPCAFRVQQTSPFNWAMYTLCSQQSAQSKLSYLALWPIVSLSREAAEICCFPQQKGSRYGSSEDNLLLGESPAIVLVVRSAVREMASVVC